MMKMNIEIERTHMIKSSKILLNISH